MLDVKTIRKLTEGLPDDAPVFPRWADGPPSDADPAVELVGLARGTDHWGKEGLVVLVNIVYLEDVGDEDEDEELEGDDE